MKLHIYMPLDFEYFTFSLQIQAHRMTDCGLKKQLLCALFLLVVFFVSVDRRSMRSDENETEPGTKVEHGQTHELH